MRAHRQSEMTGQQHAMQNDASLRASFWPTGDTTQCYISRINKTSFEYLQEEPACRAKALVSKLLRHDPARRPTARRALDDAWLNQFKGTEEEPSYKNGPVRLPVGDDARLAPAEYRNRLQQLVARVKSRSSRPPRVDEDRSLSRPPLDK